MTVYMEVTTDEYQLPLAVADSPAELARLRGVSKNAVNVGCYKSKYKLRKTERYIAVEIDDD